MVKMDVMMAARRRSREVLLLHGTERNEAKRSGQGSKRLDMYD